MVVWKSRYYSGKYSLWLRFVFKHLSTDCCILQSFHMFLQNRNNITWLMPECCWWEGYLRVRAASLSAFSVSSFRIYCVSSVAILWWSSWWALWQHSSHRASRSLCPWSGPSASRLRRLGAKLIPLDFQLPATVFMKVILFITSVLDLFMFSLLSHTALLCRK